MPATPPANPLRETHRDLPITEARLAALGFQHIDLGDDSPYDTWTKHGIAIWDYNGHYWLVDLLDQAGIDRRLRTFGDLDLFFIGCGLDLYA